LHLRFDKFYIYYLKGDYNPIDCPKGYLVPFRDLQLHSLEALNESGIQSLEELDSKITGMYSFGTKI